MKPSVPAVNCLLTQLEASHIGSVPRGPDPILEESDDQTPTFNLVDQVPNWEVGDLGAAEILRRGIWRYTPVYKENVKGNPMVWWIGFDIKSNEMLLTHGYVGGIIRTDRTQVAENKSGRSLYQQALLEMRHRCLIKWREGYRPPGMPAPEVAKPMLASKWEPGKTRLKYPVYIQPKMDGIRCLVRSNSTSGLTYRSRSNREWSHLGPHFDAELSVFLSYIPYIVELDGEMYIHGMHFEEFTSVFKNERTSHPLLPALIYYIFDFNCQESLPYESRITTLGQALRRYLEDGYTNLRFKLLDTLEAKTIDDIYEAHSNFRSLGFEGTIIRKIAGANPSPLELKAALYKSGRCNNLLKFKDFQEEEGLVIGVTSALGTEAGKALLTIQDRRGNQIVMRPAFDFETRSLWLAHPELVQGRRATFVFQDLSSYGVPRFPVVKAFRDYE